MPWRYSISMATYQTPIFELTIIRETLIIALDQNISLTHTHTHTHTLITPSDMEEIFSLCMGSVPTQHRGKLSSY